MLIPLLNQACSLSASLCRSSPDCLYCLVAARLPSPSRLDLERELQQLLTVSKKPLLLKRSISQAGADAAGRGNPGMIERHNFPFSHNFFQGYWHGEIRDTTPITSAGSLDSLASIFQNTRLSSLTHFFSHFFSSFLFTDRRRVDDEV
jgi:hypothetical protein